MKLPRLVHKIYANLLGYFWLPCPICEHYYGGHEWNNDVSIPLRNGIERGICNQCASKFKAQFPDDAVVKVDPTTLKPFDSGWRRI